MFVSNRSRSPFRFGGGDGERREEMAAARGQKAVAALPHLVKSLRSEPVSNAPRLRHLPSLR